MSKTVRVAVTGTAGQVAYSMLARLASGEVFGPATKVRLQLLVVHDLTHGHLASAEPIENLKTRRLGERLEALGDELE